MQKELISIIIPCYNTEKYLEKCLNSLLNQTYKNLEIILIDDKSQDDTLKIIKKYGKKYRNIKYLTNEENSGAGVSRNKALKEATGSIISFIDSDDYLEENYYEEMINTMNEEQADLVLADIFIRYLNKEETDVRSVACDGELSKENLVNNGLCASPCNKIFKKDLIMKYPFAEGIMNEDVPTVIACLLNAKKIAYNKEVYYNYVQHKTSVQNAALSKKKLDIFKALDLLEERIKHIENFEKYWDMIVFQQLVMLFIYVVPKEKSFKVRRNFLKSFNKLAKKYNIKQNPHYWYFIDVQGKKHQIYYRFLVNLSALGLSFIPSMAISFSNWYKNKFVKPVIKENITLQLLIEEAKKQQKLKNNNLDISVVVPNYNYEKFLYQRIYSILYQKVKIKELIILDDCSKDNSRELINEMVEVLSPYINIKKIYNETNSGTAFKQWQKGFEVSTGKYIWIAEADDYCRNSFLKKVTKPLKNNDDIAISYSDTAFIDTIGKVIYRSIIPEIDIMKTKHWDKSYINDGKEEIKNYAFLNCTIANVSSVVFKRGDYNKYFKISGEYRQAGDWLFYINLMNEGKVAFYNKALNFYRVHGNNVTSTTKKQAHFDEIKRIHEYVDKKFKLNKTQKKEINKRYAFLKKVWNLD